MYRILSNLLFLFILAASIGACYLWFTTTTLARDNQEPVRDERLLKRQVFMGKSVKEKVLELGDSQALGDED